MGTLDTHLIIWNLIAFGLLLIVMKYVLWPKIDLFLTERRKKIEELISRYNQLNVEVAKKLDEIREEHRAVRLKSEKFIEEAKTESKKLREEIIQKGYNEAAYLLARAKEDITRERESMFTELRKHISTIVVRSVEEILKDVVDERLDAQINNEVQKATEISG